MHSIILIGLLCLCSCFQWEVRDEVLDFPHFSLEIISSGCEEILSHTPEQTELVIFSDSIIDLSTIDSRLDIELKFDWFYEILPEGDTTGRMLLWPNCIGISSIQTLKESAIIDEINLVDIIEVEAFERPYDDGYKRLKSITLKDINMDSYLDIVMTKECGRNCYEANWIYNPQTEIFSRSDDTFDYITPLKYECSKEGVLLYSYYDGGWYGATYHAYRILDDSLGFVQSKMFRSDKADFNYVYYENATGDTLRVDTLSKK